MTEPEADVYFTRVRCRSLSADAYGYMVHVRFQYGDHCETETLPTKEAAIAWADERYDDLCARLKTKNPANGKCGDA